MTLEISKKFNKWCRYFTKTKAKKGRRTLEAERLVVPKEIEILSQTPSKQQVKDFVGFLMPGMHSYDPALEQAKSECDLNDVDYRMNRSLGAHTLNAHHSMRSLR